MQRLTYGLVMCFLVSAFSNQCCEALDFEQVSYEETKEKFRWEVKWDEFYWVAGKDIMPDRGGNTTLYWSPRIKAQNTGEVFTPIEVLTFLGTSAGDVVRHEVKFHEDGDAPKGDGFSKAFTDYGFEVTGEEWSEDPIFEKSVRHMYNPSPNHGDVYKVFYKLRGGFDQQIYLLYTGAHVGPAPIPEPSSIVLLFGGVIGLGGFAWRRKM